MDITIIITKLKEEMKKLFAVKEDVPTKTSDLINDNDFATTASIPTKTSDLINDVGFLIEHQDITNKENISNKIASLSSSNTNTQYPSAKCVYDNIKNKLEVTTETTLGSGGGTVWIATSSDKTNKNGWKIKDGVQNTFANITYTNANINIGNAEVDITYQNKIKRPIRISYTITYNDNQQSNTKTATVNPGEEIYDIFVSIPEPEPDYSGDDNSIDDTQEWMRYIYNVKSIQYTIYGQSSNINAIANICYPVGSVYTSTDNTNPIFIFGGQWESITSETNNYRWKRSI